MDPATLITRLRDHGSLLACILAERVEQADFDAYYARVAAHRERVELAVGLGEAWLEREGELAAK